MPLTGPGRWESGWEYVLATRNGRDTIGKADKEETNSPNLVKVGFSENCGLIRRRRVHSSTCWSIWMECWPFYGKNLFLQKLISKSAGAAQISNPKYGKRIKTYSILLSVLFYTFICFILYFYLFYSILLSVFVYTYSILLSVLFYTFICFCLYLFYTFICFCLYLFYTFICFILLKIFHIQNPIIRVYGCLLLKAHIK